MPAVFVYGSLAYHGEVGDLLGVEPVEGIHYAPAVLPGWCRDWNVCTDNTTSTAVAYYRPGTTTRPPVQVLFLNIGRSSLPGAQVSGFLIPVTPAQLAVLDAREANYDRVGVTAEVAHAPTVVADVIWAYVAKPLQSQVARAAMALGTARIRRAYLNRVRAAFAASPAMTAELDASLTPPPAPTVDLDRHLIH
jgi:hypothetical protein